VESFSIVGSQLLIGLSRSMILFIVAAGLTVVLGVLRVINFAHGAMYMLGAFLAYSVVAWTGASHGGFWVALLVAPLLVALISLLVERGLLRWVYHREHLVQLLLTYALVLIISDVIKILWGTGFKSIPIPGELAGSVQFMGASLPVYNFLLVGAGPVVAVCLWYFFSRTRLGKMCRATATDRETVDTLGINSAWVFAVVFSLGGLLAGLGGALIAPTTNIVQGMDVAVVVKVFLIVVVGGLGNIWGALLASLVFGVGESMGIMFWPRGAIVLPFLISALLLIVRPNGLLKSVW